MSSVKGLTVPGFEPIADALEALGDADPTYSAHVCAVRGSETVVDLIVGDDLAADSLISVFSSSKGIAALSLSLLIDSGDLDPDAPVARYWPEFAAGGKEAVTVRTALSHQAGLIGVAGGFTLDDVVEHHDLAARLAAASPLWAPGTAHGYHGVTIGTIIAELVARITGMSFNTFFRTNVTDAIGADFHFGVPEADQARIVELLPPKADEEQPEEPEPLSLVGLAFGGGLMPPMRELVLQPLVVANGPVGFGGFGNAHSMAHLYAQGLGDGLFPVDALRRMSQIHATGTDLVLGIETRFGLVFQVPDARLDFGSPWAFGHDGAGGAIAFADPARDLAFGYTTSRVPIPAGAHQPGLDLARKVRACLRSGRHSRQPGHESKPSHSIPQVALSPQEN